VDVVKYRSVARGDDPNLPEYEVHRHAEGIPDYSTYSDPRRKHHVYRLTEDACDVVNASVRVRFVGCITVFVDVSEKNPVFFTESIDVIGNVPSFGVGNGNFDYVALIEPLCERGVGSLNAQVCGFTLELRRDVFCVCSLDNT